ncbi:MAG: hypothetical protein IPO31_25560 [Candidatus Obscuribacter sp.]|nr:hypothetical protein [Candidatus Obscuribacter sp.]
MSINDLLLWMSMREQGSWTQFRDAVERFHVDSNYVQDGNDSGGLIASGTQPSYQNVSFDLQRLAHAEFFFSTEDSGADWRVVPPCISIHNHNDLWLGIVCGARSPESIFRIRQLGEIAKITEIEGRPDRITLAQNDLTELKHRAVELGLLVQLNAPETILASLPRIDDERYLIESEPPPIVGWTIETFSCAALEWKVAEAREWDRADIGLFRFTRSFYRRHYLKWHGMSYCINGLIGKYLVLKLDRTKTRGPLRYDNSTERFSCPAICRPPMLIERALVLCTGDLPEWEKNSTRIVYNGVSSQVAKYAATLLCQEI